MLFSRIVLQILDQKTVNLDAVRCITKKRSRIRISYAIVIDGNAETVLVASLRQNTKFLVVLLSLLRNLDEEFLQMIGILRLQALIIVAVKLEAGDTV